MAYRIEADSIGTKEVPVEAYYGVQSMRGTENFQITGQKMQPEFINSMAEIKKACAICNHMVGELDEKIKDAICFSLNSIKMQDLTECKLRGHASPLDKVLFNSKMQRAT